MMMMMMMMRMRMGAMVMNMTSRYSNDDCGDGGRMRVISRHLWLLTTATAAAAAAAANKKRKATKDVSWHRDCFGC